MSLPASQQEELKQIAADLAAQIKAGQINVQRFPRRVLAVQEARDFVADLLITKYGIDRKLIFPDAPPVLT
jgi:hypothetical protein